MTKLQDFLNSSVSDVAPMARHAKQGDLFGVELECEGVAVGFDGMDEKLLKDWAPHNDGSLRAYKGNPPCEWVFNGPVKYKQAVERVNSIFDYFDKQKTKLVQSNRTSVHVHFNMGDKNAYQLVNMFILFTILEDLMDRYCGEDRNGNLFCLSSRHAEEQVRWMQDACFKNLCFNYNEQNRYTSFNVAAINKFGTVEFRGMRGLDNREDILAWLDILNEFTDYACYKMKNPVTLIEEISIKTPIGFIKEVFSKENFLRLTKGIDESDINNSIYEGLRLVQMLCYKIGTEFDQVRLRGRDFWESFNNDVEPEPDIDPGVFLGRAAPPPQKRGGRGGLRIEPALLADPFRAQMVRANEVQALQIDQMLNALRQAPAGLRDAQWVVAPAQPPVPEPREDGDDVGF
jgi:hypothetical protein